MNSWHRARARSRPVVLSAQACSHTCALNAVYIQKRIAFQYLDFYCDLTVAKMRINQAIEDHHTGFVWITEIDSSSYLALCFANLESCWSFELNHALGLSMHSISLSRIPDIPWGHTPLTSSIASLTIRPTPGSAKCHSIKNMHYQTRAPILLTFACKLRFLPVCCSHSNQKMHCSSSMQRIPAMFSLSLL